MVRLLERVLLALLLAVPLEGRDLEVAVEVAVEAPGAVVAQARLAEPVPADVLGEVPVGLPGLLVRADQVLAAVGAAAAGVLGHDAGGGEEGEEEEGLHCGRWVAGSVQATNVCLNKVNDATNYREEFEGKGERKGVTPFGMAGGSSYTC